MISLLGKKVDVNPTKALIIDLSKLEELAPLEIVYDITVFKTINNLKKDFESFLAALDSTLTQKTPENTSTHRANMSSPQDI
jgi:hypothetical protein